MRYGFDGAGGFIVVDDFKRVSAYAFRTSIHANAAKKNAEGVAREMIRGARRFAYAHIVESAYVRHSSELDSIA